MNKINIIGGVAFIAAIILVPFFIMSWIKLIVEEDSMVNTVEVTLSDIESNSYPWHLFPLAKYATRDADGRVVFHIYKPCQTSVQTGYTDNNCYRWHSLGPMWVLPSELWPVVAHVPWEHSLRSKPQLSEVNSNESL